MFKEQIYVRYLARWVAFLFLLTVLLTVGVRLVLMWPWVVGVGILLLSGLSVLKFAVEADGPVTEIEHKVSADGIVVGTIQAWGDGENAQSKRYVARVKRNYDRAVFVEEEEFHSLAKAQVWLKAMYADQLAKHLRHIEYISPKSLK